MKIKNENVPTEYLMAEFDALSLCESLGFYNCCEMTTMFLYNKEEKETYNVFTIFVFEERLTVRKSSQYLTEKCIKITDSFVMGIQRKVVSTKDVRGLFEQLCKNRDSHSVDLGSGALRTGTLEGVPKVFVQQDGTREILLNRVLKNNFKNGSYLLEFFDSTKNIKSKLSAQKMELLCNKIYKYVPVDLFTVSDRIGNFLFQFPSINVNIEYESGENERKLKYHVSLDERISAENQYQLQVEVESDQNIIGFGTTYCEKNGTDLVFDVGDCSHICKTLLVDMKRQLIISRRESVFMRVINTNMYIGSQFGNERVIYDASGHEVTKIKVSSVMKHQIREPIVRARERSIKARQYKKRVDDLYKWKEFRSYGSTRQENEKEEVINDVIDLMKRANSGRVLLWDPYLSAEEILKTWYYTNAFGIAFMAITSAEIAEKKHISVPKWMEEQRRIFEARSNNYGINLEMRCQRGEYGYKFHDRFLMIEEENELPQVWSLGTSLNGVGTKHHIIQKIEHPKMIVDLFDQLWEQLEVPECLVWKRGRS